MNNDPIQGTAKNIAGRAQEGAGKVIGNKKRQAKGLAHQIEGKTHKMVGDATEIVRSK